MYANNQLMFPHSAIVELRTMRGPAWTTLVDRVCQLSQTHSETHEECLAFMLMMIRLNGCTMCETDSYRAMRGCVACAVQTLRRYKGTDAELLTAFDQALDEVRRYAVRTGKTDKVSGTGVQV